MFKRFATALAVVLSTIAPNTIAASDAKDNPNRWYVGIDIAGAAHDEEGLDSSKGTYSVSYSSLGGMLNAQFVLPEYYFEGGVGLLRLMSLTVNSAAIDMTTRVQWHVPFYGYAFYRISPIFAMGGGLTHLTETTMFLNGSAVPNSSYNHIFLDMAAELTPEISERLKIKVMLIGGLNLIPGRQHTYSVFDLLHVRLQLNVGVLYRLF